MFIFMNVSLRVIWYIEGNYFPTKLLFSATRFDSTVLLIPPLYQSSAGIAVSMKNLFTRPVVLTFGFPHLPHQIDRVVAAPILSADRLPAPLLYCSWCQGSGDEGASSVNSR